MRASQDALPHLKAAQSVLDQDQIEKVRRFHRRQTQDRLDAVRAGRGGGQAK